MEARLKPTNEEIVEYIWGWVAAFDVGKYLEIKDGNKILVSLSQGNFETLRAMFTPSLYNSIQEWVEDN